jgi:sugar phosphate isomerase/epimerase
VANAIGSIEQLNRINQHAASTAGCCDQKTSLGPDNMSPTDRRQFCKSVALPLAAAALMPSALMPSAVSQASEKPGVNPTGSHLRVSLNAFSFNKMLRENAKDSKKGIDLFGLCDFCASLNIDAVDLTGYYFLGYPDVPKDDYIFRLKRHAFDLGLEISGTGVRNDFVVADETIRQESIQRVKSWIEVSAKLGAPVIRVFAQTWPPFRNWRQAAGTSDRPIAERRIADALRECCEHGQKFGVIVGVQNHGDFLKTGQEHLSLIERVGHDWCGVLVDTGRYLSDDPYADIALTAPHAVNWQIKQAMGHKSDATPMDYLKLLTIIRKSGYRGNIPIETLPLQRPDYDPFTEVPKVLSEVRKAMKSTSSIKSVKLNSLDSLKSLDSPNLDQIEK